MNKKLLTLYSFNGSRNNMGEREFAEKYKGELRCHRSTEGDIFADEEYWFSRWMSGYKLGYWWLAQSAIKRRAQKGQKRENSCIHLSQIQ